MGNFEMTQDELKKLVVYNPDSGFFTANFTRGPVKVGKILGAETDAGYWRIQLNSQRWYAHRLAWLYMTGKWPAGEIDHIDGSPRNNKWANLREATRSENSHNRIPSDGVYWDSKRKVWRTTIQVNGCRKYLGSSTNKEDVKKLYLAAKNKVTPRPCEYKND